MTEGDERFAKHKFKAWFLEPVIPEEVINEVEDPKKRKLLRRGTIQGLNLQKRLQGVKEYEYYIARSRTSSASQQIDSIQSLIRNLNESVKELKEKSEEYEAELLSARGYLPSDFHNNPQKNAWRRKLYEFTKREIARLGKDPSEMKVAVLPGLEDLEIDVYRSLGMLPQNIFCFEGGSKYRKDKCRKLVNSLGCRFIPKRIEDIIWRDGTEFDILSIDPDGYITHSLFEMFLKVNLADEAIVLKNSLSQRENDPAKDLLKETKGRRDYLDVALMKLCSTADTNPHEVDSGVHALRIAREVRKVAKLLAKEIAKVTKLDPARITDLLGELYLGSRHIAAFAQFNYISGSGSPFQSTFARLRKWDSDIRDSSASQSLRDLMAHIIEVSTQEGREFEPSDIQLKPGSNGHISFVFPNTRECTFRTAMFKELYQYFLEEVPDEHLLKSLMLSEVSSLSATGTDG